MPPSTATSSCSDDAALVAAARGGDSDAFAALVDRYHDRLMATVRVLAGAEPCEDVAQEVWLQAQRDLWQLRTDEAFWPWLRQIAKRNVYRSTRRRRAEQPSDRVAARLPPAASAESVMEAEARSRRVWETLDRLHGRDHDIIRYRFVEGRSPAEVAGLLQVTIGTVYTATQRARASFAAAFERTHVMLAPGLLGLVERFRRVLRQSACAPDAMAAVILAAALMVAPALLDAAEQAEPSRRGERSNPLDTGRTSTASTSRAVVEALTTQPASSRHEAAARDRSDLASTVVGASTGHRDLLPVQTVGRRVTTYDGDFTEHNEPDVRVGNDDLVAVRVWPYEHLPIERPPGAPALVIDPSAHP